MLHNLPPRPLPPLLAAFLIFIVLLDSCCHPASTSSVPSTQYLCYQSITVASLSITEKMKEGDSPSSLF